MRKLLLLLIFPYFSLNAQVLCHDNYLYKDSLLYLGSDTLPYTGPYREYYPGELKTKGYFTLGVRDGEFVFYDKNSGITRIENYKNGIRDGVSKTFRNRNEKKHLIRKEIYSHGKLDTLITWSLSGQIEKMQVYTDEPKIETFKVDSNVFELVPFIAGKKNGTVNRSELLAKDSFKLEIGKVTCTNCYFENIQIRDTIVLSNFEVKSFSVTNICRGSDIMFYYTGNYIAKNALKYIEECNSGKFYIFDILIEDENGFEYELPQITYQINSE